ncbi:MAG: hypothetical protein WA277_13310 [Nitrospirota bacterium]
MEYVPPPIWKAPVRTVPSESFQGEASPSPIHEAVGCTLSKWEHAESGNIKLFQLLCKTKSFAACRAYGTLDSVFSRHLALKYAAEEFFRFRDKDDHSRLNELINIYNNTGQYRNQVAHGMAVQPHAHGYFLCPPSYASRRRGTPIPTEKWGIGADYFYRVKEIDHIGLRFEQILLATMSLIMYLNEKYSILEGREFHP